jgi:hypothetical protein
MSVTVKNVNPTSGGTLTSVGAGTVQATGTFDETATISATLVYGASTWQANQDGNRFVLQSGQSTVQWAVTFGPPGGVPVPGGLQNCTLTVTGTAADGSGSSIILVNTPRGATHGASTQQARGNGQVKKGATPQKPKAVM